MFAETHLVAHSNMFSMLKYTQILVLQQNFPLVVRLCTKQPQLSKVALGVVLHQGMDTPRSFVQTQRHLVTLLEELDDEEGTLTKLALGRMFTLPIELPLSCAETLSLDQFETIRKFVLVCYPHILWHLQAKMGRPDLALQTLERVLRINLARRHPSVRLETNITDPWQAPGVEISINDTVTFG